MHQETMAPATGAIADGEPLYRFQAAPTLPEGLPPPPAGVVDVTRVQIPPYPIKTIAPRVPFLIHERRQVGVVVIVDQSGRVISAEVHGTAESAFAREAIYTIKQWRFKPALIDGRAVASRLYQTVIWNPPLEGVLESGIDYVQPTYRGSGPNSTGSGIF